MFCGNCGKQNPDGAKFCTACGSALNVTPAGQTQTVQQTPPAYQQPPVQQVPPVQKAVPAKKKAGGLKKFIISAVVFVVMFACSFLAATWENGSDLPDVEPSGSAPSNAYGSIYWNYGPGTPESDFAGQGLKTVSYVIHHGDNMLENMEYVYEDGAVLVMVDSIYIPIYGLDDAAKAEMNTMMLSNLTTYTNLSFCQLSSYEHNGYYIYKLIFTDLDKKENVHQLSATGMITIPEGESRVDKIGIKITEDNLLAQGYVKR